MLCAVPQPFQGDNGLIVELDVLHEEKVGGDEISGLVFTGFYAGMSSAAEGIQIKWIRHWEH